MPDRPAPEAGAEGPDRTLAPFGRRLCPVVSHAAIGAYDVISVLDAKGPAPDPGQFYMLAAADRCERAVGHADVAGVAVPLRCSSCSEITGGPPATRLAAIARVAAIPPVSVVMQGMPRATAARRIS